MSWPGLIKAYSSFLPHIDPSHIVTLNEGNTPLIELKRLPEKIGLKARWFVKYEGLNPTGSFKDRGMTMAISKAKEAGSKMVMCASTGNTSAAAAAYAARANMGCAVLIPEGKISLGKLAQAMMYGAIVLQIEGNFDQALDMVRTITKNYPITLVNSVNPDRIEGQKTGSFEIVDTLKDAPDYHVVPVGNAGNITAYWKGYLEYFNHGKSKKKPKMLGFQAEGAAPLVKGHPIENPETIATAIRIGNPASWQGAITAKTESQGTIDIVSDEDITQAQQWIAQYDGVFCEPASAASIAGVIKHKDLFKEGETIVSVLTGNGLKDPNRAIEISPKPYQVSNTTEAILAHLNL